MNSCELVTFVSTVSCVIADCTEEENLELLAAIFTQLGDSLATIAVHRSICCPGDEDEDVGFVN